MNALTHAIDRLLANSRTDRVTLPDAPEPEEVFMLRDDLIHPLASGNKLRKLKFHLLQARAQRKTALLTFGGAYSNHLPATAAAGTHFGFDTIGIVRGEELSADSNLLLRHCARLGMKLRFASRREYARRAEPAFVEALAAEFPQAHLIPEGGSGPLGEQGVAEIHRLAETHRYTHLCVAAGTGATARGLAATLPEKTALVAFSVHPDADATLAGSARVRLVPAHHELKYGRIDPPLIEYCRAFHALNGVLLDPLYTSRMARGLARLIKEKELPAEGRYLLIHTGGLHGWSGFEAAARTMTPFLPIPP